jgi:hypothetical protein
MALTPRGCLTPDLAESLLAARMFNMPKTITTELHLDVVAIDPAMAELLRWR